MLHDSEQLIAAYRANPEAIVRDSVPDDHIVTLTPAAVLIPVIAYPEELRVLLTQRSELLKNHAGQISFPGGRRDESDRSLEDTALRETAEEVGLTRDYIEVLGPTATYATVTGFVITPILALVRPGFELKLQTEEVVDAFEAPLNFLLDPANQQRRELTYQGQRRHYYEIPWNGRHIWGATATMLRNLGKHLHPDRYR